MAAHNTPSRIEKILFGAYSSLDDLISARFNAKDLNLQLRKKTLSLLTGPNKTNFRGRGIDFEEVRAYQAGDDIRTIDWRVTARSGIAYTKLFQEERERPMLVVVDQRQGMFFGSKTCFKSVLACYVGALVAWSGLQQSDRVGGMVFGNEYQQEIRPRRSRKTVLSLIHLMLEYNQKLNKNTGMECSPEQRLEETLIELRRIARPGSALYIVSDFAGFDSENVQKHLYQLARHCEITGILISDPMERELPPPGQYTVSNGEQREVIHTGAQQSRHHYAERFQHKVNDLQTQLNKLGVPLIEMATDQAPLQRLLRFYGNRSVSSARTETTAT